MIEVRKLLCVSIGKLHAFLQDTFGEVLEADPRSTHDADYFLSRRFPRDIEEAEWLFASVKELESFVRDLERERYDRLTLVGSQVRREEYVPVAQTWTELKRYVSSIMEDLTPRRAEILALRGIRFDEMEILDKYASQIPTKSRLAIEVGDTGRKAIEFVKEMVGTSEEAKQQNLVDLAEIHAVFSRRIVGLLGDVDRSLQDLWVFIPIWLQNIERRRALMLRRENPDVNDGRDFGD